MAAPTITHYVLGSGSGGGGAHNSIRWTSGLAQAVPAGRKVYVLGVTEAATSVTPASGFSFVASGGSGDATWFIYEKTTGGSEPLAYSFTWTPSTADGAWLMAAFDGWTGASVGSVLAVDTNADSITAPSMTAPSGDVLLACMWVGKKSSGGWTAPGGFDARSETVGGSAVYADVLGVKSVTAGAATGDQTVTASAGTGRNGRVGVQFCIAYVPPFIPPLQVGHHGTHNPPGLAGPPLRAGPAAGGQFSPQVQRGHRY